jgi:hypothetical protein
VPGAFNAITTGEISINIYPTAQPTNVTTGISFNLGNNMTVKAKVSFNRGYTNPVWSPTTFKYTPNPSYTIIDGETGFLNKDHIVQTFNYGGFSLWKQMKSPEHYTSAWQGATYTFDKMYN